MKNYRYIWATLAALTLAAPVQAAENPVYFGFKAGLMNPDAGGHDNALNVGALIGFDIAEDQRGIFSVEAEGTTTLRDGDKEHGGDWNVDTLAAYFVYRTAGDAFFKAKAGFVSQNIAGTSDVPEGSSFSGGIGGGFHITRKAGIEAEVTWLDDIRFFSIGFFSRF